MKILVLSSTASATNCILSLRRRPGVELFVTDAAPRAAGLYEPGITPLVIPRARDLDRYRAALDAILTEQEIDILLPTSDRDIEGVVRLLDSGWSPTAQVFRPPLASLEILAQKERLYRAVAAAGTVPVPRTLAIDSVPKFPVVLKPVDEGGSKGVVIAETQEELEAAARAHQARFAGDYVIQEFIPGGIGDTYVALLLYDQEGRAVSGAALRSSLMFLTWGGGGNAGAIADEPRLLELAEEVVRIAGGWRGPVNVEFRRHAETGEFYLLEANARLNGYSYLTTMNGFDFPGAIVDLLTGAPLTLPRRVPGGGANFVLGFRERPVSAWLAPPEPSC